MAKKGACIQNWIDLPAVPAATFMRASAHCQLFVASTLVEDFSGRYRGRFVLDPFEILVSMVLCVEHARRLAAQQNFTGVVHFMFRYRGLAGRELAFWRPDFGVSPAYGHASENELNKQGLFEVSETPLDAGTIFSVVRPSLDEVLMNFDLRSVGQKGMPDQAVFERLAQQTLQDGRP